MAVLEIPENNMMAALDRMEGRSLKGDGDPPDNGDMETRIAKLESFAQEAGERLARVETTLNHIDREVGQFKWWLIGAVFTVILTVIATSVGIQQMTVTTFQAAGEQAGKQTAPQPIIINVPPASPPAAPAR